MRFLIVTLFVCALGACDDSTDLSPAPHDSGAAEASAEGGAKDAGAD